MPRRIWLRCKASRRRVKWRDPARSELLEQSERRIVALQTRINSHNRWCRSNVPSVQGGTRRPTLPAFPLVDGRRHDTATGYLLHDCSFIWGNEQSKHCQLLHKADCGSKQERLFIRCNRFTVEIVLHGWPTQVDFKHRPSHTSGPRNHAATGKRWVSTHKVAVQRPWCSEDYPRERTGQVVGKRQHSRRTTTAGADIGSSVEARGRRFLLRSYPSWQAFDKKRIAFHHSKPLRPTGIRVPCHADTEENSTTFVQVKTRLGW